MGKTNQEYIDEFLAKGGKVIKCLPSPTPDTKNTYKTTNSGPAKLMTLLEGELFYGEPSKRKKKKKLDLSKVDLNEIPEELKKKLGI